MATKPNTPGETDMGPCVLKGKMRPVSWNALEKVESFTKVVKAKLDRLKARQSSKVYPKTPLSDDDLDRVIMAIWCVCYSGIQWRTVAFLTKLPFGTVYSCFSRWTRLGLWKAIVSDLLQQWRETCGDCPEPSVLVMDSRSCRSAPSCGQRGIDGGKKIKGVKINLMVDKHGIPVTVAITTANVHDTVGILTPLKEVADKGFRGKALGDLSYQGKKLKTIGQVLGIDVVTKRCGAKGTFLPTEIRWVVERSFAWLSRYRRLNTIFERTEHSLVAFVWIAFISILADRFRRLETAENQA